ncbi:GNAT family N-acetyltransferase [Aurantiacibacter sp. MUD61]|uniref:GNAT family N-acetyltransferase n=1 Tax=Aurantiacibacter sp. MUD61 TaxID=3009083 RepID=UPI0022F05260|nr:GNAT family N-acetyltransferase [Aurantiacibacter sp. MUD61]
MTAVSYHDTVNDLQEFDWLADGPFARLEWFRLLESNAENALFALAQDGHDAVALPQRKTNGGLEILSNWYAFTWAPLGTSAPPSRPMLEALAKDISRRADRVMLDKLPDETGDATACEGAFRRAGWFVSREPCDVNHYLDLGTRDYAAFLADRPGQLRTTLKRKAKKVDVTLSTRFDESEWEAYEDIYTDSWKPEEGAPEVLRAFAEQESTAGRYRFAIARHEGRAIAAQFWTVDGGTAYIHKLAHRKDAKALSPGTTLTAALFQHVIDMDRVQQVDFGTGDDPYKRDWMEQKRLRWRLTCYRRSSPRNWLRIGKAMTRKLVSRETAG